MVKEKEKKRTLKLERGHFQKQGTYQNGPFQMQAFC